MLDSVNRKCEKWILQARFQLYIVLKKNLLPVSEQKMSINNFIPYQTCGKQEWVALNLMINMKNVSNEQDVRCFEGIAWKTNIAVYIADGYCAKKKFQSTPETENVNSQLYPTADTWKTGMIRFELDVEGWECE